MDNQQPKQSRMQLVLDGFLSRKLIHFFLNGSLAIIALIVPAEFLVPIAGVVFVVVFLLELIRLTRSARRMLRHTIAPMLKRHEHTGFSAIFWAAAAAFIVSAFADPLAMSYGLAVFATADPAAAVIGTKFPSRKLFLEKTLFGSLTFFFVALGITVLYALFIGWHPVYYLYAPVLAAVLTVVELYSERLDDNFTVLLVGVTLMHLIS